MQELVITASDKDPALPTFTSSYWMYQTFFLLKFHEVCKAQVLALHVNTEKHIPVNKVVSVTR